MASANDNQQFDPRAYWNRRLEKQYNLAGVGYLALGKEYNRWLYRIRDKLFRRSMRSLGLNWGSANILEIGPGTGFYVERWQELGVKSLTGIDLSRFAVENLRRKFPNYTFLEADISEPPLSLVASSFDLVAGFDVFFHIVDDDRYRTAFRRISEVLKPGGVFAFSENLPRQGTVRETHIVSRSLEAVARILDENGLEIVKRVPMFAIMNYPIDSTNRLAQVAWNAMTTPARWSNVYGFVLGGALYPIELVLTTILKESPTTELVLCRRAG